MALEEDQSSVLQELRSAADCLRSCHDLALVESLIVDELAAGCAHFSLPAGGRLFDAGAAPDGVYLLVSGRLRVGAIDRASGQADIAAGELVGEVGWLLCQPHELCVTALRDSELLWMPANLLERASGRSPALSLALARLCARRVQRSTLGSRAAQRGRVFVIVPNDVDIDIAELATQLVNEFASAGTAELVWEVRASAHTSAWFSRIEEMNDFVVYVADPAETTWTRQCCRQADVILLAARARADSRPWPRSVVEAAQQRAVRVELALLHDAVFAPGRARAWLATVPIAGHHHLSSARDLRRMARLITRRGVGLVLSGGGARGFAHLGVVRALREAGVPIDFVGGTSIGAIMAAGVAMDWPCEEMLLRYRRGFVATNPVNDYTFPWVALTKGRKVSRLLAREYGEVLIEDLPIPYFCVSANLATGRIVEHRDGRLWEALRAAVSIPGIMPPVPRGADILVDGATINNFPVDTMLSHSPGLVIGSDVGADRVHTPERRLNVLQILTYSGLINSAAAAATQRSLADVLLKPPLAGIDLLNWRAFDRAIEAGYSYTRQALENHAGLPRLTSVAPPRRETSSLQAELEKRERVAAG